MATIEERSRQHALAAVYGDENDSLYKDIETECIKLATEQDRVSRADEREKCIKAAQELVVEIVEDLLTRYCETWNEASKHQTLENIRKAIEEGGNNDNN